ncbi:MAG: bifunctional diguanylate cyclase/phosphodiesterase [Mycobacteriales bacterium]
MSGRGRGARRLFAAYAAVSLVPVVLLGGVLGSMVTSQANSRGLAQAGDEAALVAHTVVAPLLHSRPLTHGLSQDENAALANSVGAAVRDGQVLRLRLRDLSGRVVFADDGHGVGDPADDEALQAVHGNVVTKLSRLNADEGSAGPRVVEAYEPLTTTASGQRIGVVELYLPYAPIAAEVSRQQREQLWALSGGLLVLWLVLLGVTASTTRHLRGLVRENAHLARHDALTGLPNRTQFVRRAREALGRGPVALAMVDLDRFRQVNDALGHAIGDRLLVELAERLALHVRDGDTVARLGGDEFGIVLCGATDEAEALDAFRRTRSLLGEPLVVDDLPLAVEASIGFVLVPQDGIDLDLLLAKADVAMYAAKRRHLGVTRHHPDQDLHDATRLRLVGELAEAISTDQLVLHYQPKTDLRTGQVTAVEALIRWQHPERGLLQPDDFLPAAEQTELVDPLTRWVLRNATSALPRLDPTGELAMAVNISARSLGRGDFAEEVLRVLAETGTAPGRVLLEITETALLTEPARAALTLGQLAGAGLRVSIDDFGAGQTSLGYLSRLPVHELKIDKAFVMTMDTESSNAAIVRSVIDLGHNLGFSVTAEGVETSQVLEALRSAACDTVQGYYLGRPADEDTTRQLLQRAGVR